MRRTLFFLLFFVLSLPVFFSKAADTPDHDKKEKFTITDLVTRPVEIILTPVVGRAEGITIAKEDMGLTVPDIVVTPSGKRERAIDYPGNVTVISENDIEKTNARSVYELLRRETGIYVSDYTHAGKTVTVDMRGFGEIASRNLLVMVDGRRINEIDISGPDWAQIPIENVERIEILRGTGSVLYGDNASAGVINILTKRGETGHHFKTGSDFGSYRYRNYYTMLNGAEDFAAYNLFYKHEKTDGYRINGGYDGYDFMGAMTIYPSEFFDIDLSGGYHKDWYGLPAGLRRPEIDQVGYRGSRRPNDRSKTETTFLKISPTIRFISGIAEHALNLDVWGRKKRMNMTTWDDAGGWVPWYPSWDTSQIDSIEGSLKYNNRFQSESIVNDFVMGIDMFSAKNRLLTVTPQWGTYNQLKISKRTLGVYVNNKIDLFGKFIVNGGFRQEWAEYGFDQNRGAGGVVGAGVLESKSPRAEAFDVGLQYKYFDRGGIYMRYSRSYRFPATEEFYSRWTGLNTDLKHQKADTFEVGLKDENFSYFRPSVNLFWMKTIDEIFYDPTVGAFGGNRNYDNIRRFGIESGIRSKLVEWLDAYLNYTYLDAVFDKGIFSGNKVPMVPEHKISWGVDVSSGKFVEFNFNSEYLSEQYSINDQNNKMPRLKSYFVCNGRVVLKHNHVELFLGINNIFDARYSEIAASNVAGTVTDLHPAPGRNYVFGASVKF